DSLGVWSFADTLSEDNAIRERFALAGTSGSADPMAIKYGNHAQCITEFLETLETGHSFSVDGTEARKSVEILEAIYRSSTEKRMIEL
ncbi:MAG: gfo/Idh/MocA family oxidoreductase, partial [Phaeodactylibacter sp.]|nr:gfo/Idh/MocA family oxidoreductase [Phaeodactylibacter sp.]